jgi:hypothetical protein
LLFRYVCMYTRGWRERERERGGGRDRLGGEERGGERETEGKSKREKGGVKSVTSVTTI